MVERSTPFTFLLEILPEDSSDADPALVSALGRDVTDILREQGNTVQPAYTGERGGEFLAQVATLLTTVWANKELILSDLSNLVTILTPLALATHHLWSAYERRVGKSIAQESPIAIRIEFDGISMKIDAADRKDAVAVATDLAHHFLAQHPAVDPSSLVPTTAKVRASVPKRPTRRRR